MISIADMNEILGFNPYDYINLQDRVRYITTEEFITCTFEEFSELKEIKVFPGDFVIATEVLLHEKVKSSLSCSYYLKNDLKTHLYIFHGNRKVTLSKSEITEPIKNNIDHPQYYNYGKIEVIDIIEDHKLDFREGNALKYLLRYKNKHSSTNEQISDLDKAIWYIERIKNELKKKEENENKTK